MQEFSTEEREIIFELAEKLTGASQKGTFRREILTLNVQRRMNSVRTTSLAHYLNYALSNTQEYEQLLNALTIHTTSWFREKPHMDKLLEHLNQNWNSPSAWEKKFRIWCGASSTGEEVYSFGMILENFRRMRPGFEYELFGTDIDPVSVKKAKAAVYLKTQKSDIPRQFWNLTLDGSGRTENYFAIDPEIRKRTLLNTFDLTKALSSESKDTLSNFDWIIVRNVLIYFSPEVVKQIIHGLISRLHDEGILCLGHSEAIESRPFNLKSLSNSIYAKAESANSQLAPTSKDLPKVLVIDDSDSMRRVLKKALEREGFSVATAEGADEADNYLRSNKVDLITLDLNMPKVHGAAWLKAVRQNGMTTPVVVISDASPKEAYEVLGALEKGAQDFIEKSTLNNKNDDWPQRIKALITSAQSKSEIAKKESSASVNAKWDRQKLKLSHPDLIVIGASTGGTEALTILLKNMSPESPPVFVVQHIPPAFTRPFAERLASVSGLKLGEFTSGEVAKKGHIYLATEDAHIGVKQAKDQIILSKSNSPLVSGHRPSVDYLFRSASAVQGAVMCILLTGMGRDGARGMLELSKQGAMTLAQNEASCVVYGMPKEAVNLGAAAFTGDLREIRMQIDAALMLRNDFKIPPKPKAS